MIGLFGKRSQTKEKIINNLLEGEKSLKELSKEIGISKPGLIKHLDELEKVGILESFAKKKKESNIRIKVYKLKNFSLLVSINKEGYVVDFESTSSIDFQFPLVNQIPQKSYRKEISKYLKSISNLKRPLTIVVFGSVAKGEATWKSDIDVVLFSDSWNKEKEEILNKISDIGMKKDVKTSMNPHFKKYTEIEKSGIMKEVKKNGMIVYTSREDEILWKKLKIYQSI